VFHQPYRETPAPTSYVFTKKNRPTVEQQQEIATRFQGLHFQSAICSILYLAFNTRPDIMFMTCKLSKACHDPGIKDFEALVWLFGYLQKYPDNALKYYHDVTQSPVYQIAKSQNITQAKIVAFSNASWYDCPDTGRSTAGKLVFCKGDIIHVTLQSAVEKACTILVAQHVWHHPICACYFTNTSTSAQSTITR
jgi:hypothetical protein